LPLPRFFVPTALKIIFFSILEMLSTVNIKTDTSAILAERQNLAKKGWDGKK